MKMLNKFRYVACVIALLFVSNLLRANDVPTLIFDNGVTWQTVFDAGFRPKYHSGLENSKAVCLEQEFFLKRAGTTGQFKLDKGRLAFELLVNDKIRMVWHQGLEPITLEEGKRRAEEFASFFKGAITQEITMPHVYDPSGSVDAGNDANNVKARIGEYLFTYGFDRSFQVEKPIIPHFYIFWSFPGAPVPRHRPPEEKIQPPAGYEWYSLDPKIDTPSPGVRNVVQPKYPVLTMEQMLKNKEEREKREREEAERIRLKIEAQIPKKRPIAWGVILGVLATIGGVIYWIIKQKNGNSRG